MLNRNRGYSSSPLVPHVFQSTVSRICRVVMGPVVLQLRRRGTLVSCQNPTHGKFGAPLDLMSISIYYQDF